MTIASEIQRINNNIANAYTACNRKGATIPQNANSSNLASCINSISGGGGSNTDLRPYVKKAWGWTHRDQGKCYFINHNTDGSFNLMSAKFKKLVQNRATNYSGGFYVYILDGDFYLRDKQNNTYKKYECEINDWISYSSTNEDGFAIRPDGSLYRFSLSRNSNTTVPILVDDTGVWSNLSTYYYSGTYGIRNGALCKAFTNNTYTTIDDTGTWTDVCGLYSGIGGFAIKDGQVYYITPSDNSLTLLTSDVGFTVVSGSSYGLGICNGALYYLSRTQARLLDNTQTWVKIAGEDMALTSEGKLYKASSYSVTQIGTDTTWTDICGQSATGGIGLNNGNVYYNLSSTNNLKQLTFSGDFTQIDGQVSTMSEFYRTCAVVTSENPNSKTLYTVAYPKQGNIMYFDKNLNFNFPVKVDSVDSNFSYIEVMPAIDGEKHKYYRDTNADGNFTLTPSENSRVEELLDILEGN